MSGAWIARRPGSEEVLDDEPDVTPEQPRSGDPAALAAMAGRAQAAATASLERTRVLSRHEFHGKWNYTLSPPRDTPEPG